LKRQRTSQHLKLHITSAQMSSAAQLTYILIEILSPTNAIQISKAAAHVLRVGTAVGHWTCD